MLQHGFLDDWTYSVRTLQDNVSLVTPALLQELNALLVREEGHAVAGKFPGAALDGRDGGRGGTGGARFGRAING